jgi:hypothetical protein
MSQAILLFQYHHQYYDDGLWQTLSLKPDGDSAAFFQRYRLLLRENWQGIGLYYFGSGPFDGFMAALPDLLAGRYLRFYLHNTDPYYANISDLPLNWAGQINYDSQDVSQSNDDPKVQILNRQLAPRTISESGVIGQIIIAPVDLQAQQAPTFVIKMAARLTHWYYYLCNRSQRHFNQLSVHNNSGIVFQPPQSVTIATGEAAMLFSSGEQAFALKQSVSEPFNLVNLMDEADASSAVDGLNSQVLIEGLPIPPTDQLRIDQHNRSDDGTPYVYSPMYIYI